MSCIVYANFFDVGCQLSVYQTLYIRVRPKIISVTYFSATTYRNDLKFGMQLLHHELYRVCECH